MRFKGFASPGVVASFNEAPGGGGLADFDAPRNAPAKTPSAHVDKVGWHGDFFQYELAADPAVVVVNHPSMAGGSHQYIASILGSSVSVSVFGSAGVSDHTLVTHGLGYVPLAFVAYQGRMLTPGTPVQIESNGRIRFVRAFATSSIIGLRESRVTSSLTASSTLSAVSRSYTVLVFREPASSPNLPLFAKIAGEIILARGKARSSKRYLREVAPGETAFAINRDRTLDWQNGRSRIVTGGVTFTEGQYTGSFTGGPFKQVGF
jgi:hypothetical protein